MPRVFLSYHHVAFCDAFRRRLASEPDFHICGEGENGMASVKRVIRLRPDLVILETENRPGNNFEITEVLKMSMPDVFLFLVSRENTMRSEKDALAHGADAVFERGDDYTSLLENARSIFGNK